MPANPPPTDPWLWTTTPVPHQRYATPITVFLYTPEALDPPFFFLRDNLQCLEIRQSIGIDPGRAMFRYIFDNRDPDAPQSVEQALDKSSSLAKTILPNQRLLVQATRPDGVIENIFEGFALTFGFNLDRNIEDVHIIAVGEAKMAWNTPVGGLLIRDASDVVGGQDVQTDIPAQFNPKGIGNATKEGAEFNADRTLATDRKYSTFVDPTIERTPPISREYTLAMAARYLIFRCGYTPDSPVAPATLIAYPEGDAIDNLLFARIPRDGNVFDPNNAGTWDAEDIIAPDKPITGRDWPGLLNELIRDKGFYMTWVLDTDPTALPLMTTLTLGLLQGAEAKTVGLQVRGDSLDLNLTNLGKAQVDYDLNNIVNKWRVVGALKRYEATFILSPAFPMQANDGASLVALNAYDESSTDYADDNDAYRLFVFDEAGEGHYAPGTNTKLTTKGNLDVILGAPDIDGKPAYATRRRPSIGKCISQDDDENTYHYRLEISTDATAASPGLANTQGHWQTISGGFEILKDRLGIRITSDNPNAWKIGKSAEDQAPYPQGVVRVVESLCTNNTANPFFKLRLTCCFEGDAAVEGVASLTLMSPLGDVIARQIDARDRYQKLTICKSSIYNLTGADIVSRDDSDNALAEATANRQASEIGILDGTITIPYFTRYYKLADRISGIYGRGLSFRVDEAGEEATPVYPVVVGITHNLAGGQSTTLKISDQDGHLHQIEKKIHRKEN